MDNFLATNVWKLYPFRAGNRAWFIVLLQAYFSMMFFAFCMACMLNAVEGKRWLHQHKAGYGSWARGETALDECFWFVATTMHGVAFGDFYGIGMTGRWISCCCVATAYLFVIFVMTLIMLSQMPGEQAPSLYNVASRMFSCIWPSYCVFLSFIFAVGSIVGPYVSNDHDGLNNYGTGIYWSFTVAHRAPFGDIYPDTVFGRFLTIPLGCAGVLYLPYALACISVRRVTAEQHQRIVGQLRASPDEALGRGYVQPPEAVANSSLSEFVAHDAYFRDDSDDDSEEDGTKARSCVVVCCFVTFALMSMLFISNTGQHGDHPLAGWIAQMQHTLELDLPPGLRSAEDPVPPLVWNFWLHDYPLEGAGLEDQQSLSLAIGTDVQLVTPDILEQYNVTEAPFHPALNYLSPNHKLDYLHAYFMHNYGGGFLEIQKRKDNTTWTGPFNYIGDNESYWFLGTPTHEDVPCDESSFTDAWCKELQFKSNITYAETKAGLSSWESSKGPCCKEVLNYYSNSGLWPRHDGYIMRKNTLFTAEWLQIIHAHLDAKLPVLKMHSPPTEPCCVQRQQNYPLRWHELAGEIWAPLLMKYKEHIKFDNKLV